MAARGKSAAGTDESNGPNGVYQMSSETLLLGARKQKPKANVVVLAPERTASSQSSGAPIGPARGLVLGLIIGAVMWAGLIALVWYAFRL